MLVFAHGSALAGDKGGPNGSDIEGKFIVGYQGWFACPGDKIPGVGWRHWFDAGRPVVDMLPDVSDFEPSERCSTDLVSRGGGQVSLFSSLNASVIRRHFGWMRLYGIDGAAISRFATGLRDPASRNRITQVLLNARDAAETNQRIFFVTYDLSGIGPDEASVVAADWKDLELRGLTGSAQYGRYHGMPVLGLWGFGFSDRKMSPSAAARLMQDIRDLSKSYGGIALLGGVPAGWRANEGDASSDVAWGAVYRSFDIISPWSVGRFADDAGADYFLEHNIKPDLIETRALGIYYMPVLFPGFSWYNLSTAHGTGPSGKLNAIPRRCGKFLWHQLVNLASSGIHSGFGAMFDEVDEGTALFKTLPSEDLLPAGGHFLPLDADGCNLPSDWYLRLSGKISDVLGARARGPTSFPLLIPK